VKHPKRACNKQGSKDLDVGNTTSLRQNLLISHWQLSTQGGILLYSRGWGTRPQKLQLFVRELEHNLSCASCTSARSAEVHAAKQDEERRRNYRVAASHVDVIK
jgi:hypothetical protein